MIRLNLVTVHVMVKLFWVVELTLRGCTSGNSNTYLLKQAYLPIPLHNNSGKLMQIIKILNIRKKST